MLPTTLVHPYHCIILLRCIYPASVTMANFRHPVAHLARQHSVDVLAIGQHHALVMEGIHLALPPVARTRARIPTPTA